MEKRVIQDITKKRLSSLISKSINDKNLDKDLFIGMSENDWDELYFTSRVHTVDAIVCNEILSLDQNILPPYSVCLKMFATVESTKKLNLKIINIIEKLNQVYNSKGLDYIIFKGPVCGINYNNPLLRGVGDIDVYFYKYSDFEKANRWAKNENLVYHIDHIKHGHWSFEFDNIIIEHHNDITFFERNKYNIRFKKILSEEFKSDNFVNVTLNDAVTVKTFSDEIMYLYVFLHLFYHFVHGGVGLRQFMDWIYFAIKKRDNIDKDKFLSYCKVFDIEYPIGLFARVAVDYFDIDIDIFPFNVPDTSSDSLLLYNDIMECGNFGILDTEYWNGKWVARFHKLLKTIKRTIKIYHISPEYSIKVPFAMLINRIYLSVFK